MQESELSWICNSFQFVVCEWRNYIPYSIPPQLFRTKLLGQDQECEHWFFETRVQLIGEVRYNNPNIPPSLPPFSLHTIISYLTMKFSSVILAVFALATTGIAQKTCTPSFDYCSDVLIKDKGT